MPALPSRKVAAGELLLHVNQDERGPGEELMQFEAISQLPPEEQAVIREVLESLIIKYQTRRWDVSHAGARAAAPAKKAPPAKRAAHTAR